MPTGLIQEGSGQALDQSIQTILAEFRLLEQERGTIKRTATPLPLKPHEGTAKNILNYNRMTAYAVTHGVDITQAQTIADALTSYTPSEVAVQAIVPKLTVRRVADPALMRQVGRIMSNAMEVKEDIDGAGQFSSFTPTLGSASTVHTVGHVLAGASILRIGNNTTQGQAEPAPKPWYYVQHPNAVAAFETRLIPLFTGPGATAAGAAGVLGEAKVGALDEQAMRVLMGKAAGSLGGFTIIPNANVGGGVGGMYSKEGLVFVQELEATEEREYDASLRATELNLVESYVFGVYRPAAYGVASTFDVTTPTS